MTKGAGGLHFLRQYVRVIDRLNRWIGRVVMYGIFVMMGILLWSSISKTFFLPSLWTLEMAQFAMVAYYVLGGPYSIQMGSNVRMDLLYGEWSNRRKAWTDAITVFFLIIYLIVMLYGGYDSLSYSLQYGERSPTAWRPYLWPIKSIMIVGLFLMLLQAVSELFKDLLRLHGDDIPREVI
ncbi:TRAP transporter small permease subunit [Ruegeria jejuensis]|uniref:TRAP transporter small permease subunit n=1 Tax=Ruegeria jejuensis TaxID=3233338 RepID=UPI00355BE675